MRARNALRALVKRASEGRRETPPSVGWVQDRNMETKETYHWISMLSPLLWETVMECLERVKALKETQETLQAAKRED